jgi:hypothetical protein
MRSVIFVACLMGLLATASIAAPPTAKGKPKTVSEKIQGKWTRLNHEFSFLIQGNKISEFHETKLGKPTATGLIEFPPGKDYALAKLDNGGVLWLFVCGENVLAVESFGPDGVIWQDGRVFYGPDFVR